MTGVQTCALPISIEKVTQRRQLIKKKIFSFLVVVILVIGSALFYLQKKNYVNLSFYKKQSDVVYESCAKMMAQNICAIMGTSAQFSAEVKQIYLPQFGPLDADIYRRLLRAGPGMCEIIKQDCADDIQSETCKIGMALYSSQ